MLSLFTYEYGNNCSKMYDGREKDFQSRFMVHFLIYVNIINIYCQGFSTDFDVCIQIYVYHINKITFSIIFDKHKHLCV